jgi:hypothetical protein
MTISQLSLAVVGADFPNRTKRGPTRRFEILLCSPGEPVHLVPEPKNPADPRAIAVYSCRGVQLGYLTAERCGWIGKMIGEGREVRAIFQRAASYGAVVRAAFDGEGPTLPDDPVRQPPESGDDGFYPDPEYSDD